MCNYDRSRFQASADARRASSSMVRVGVFAVVGLTAALIVGCGELEPMHEPEVVDLQLTTDTLKASVRDAQRTVAELRADLEARRSELAEAQVARAQLEGRVREAERRVIEARQVIELQREELAVARTERVRMSRGSHQLQGQLKQMQKQFAQPRKSESVHDGQEAAPLPSRGAIRKGSKATPVPAQRNQLSEFPETRQAGAITATVSQAPIGGEPLSAVEPQLAPAKHVSVKPGDTLWSIAQKYRVNMERLRMLNQLTDNRIVIGQALWLPDDRPRSVVDADKVASTP